MLLLAMFRFLYLTSVKDYRGGYLNTLYAGESFSKALCGRDSTVPILTTKTIALSKETFFSDIRIP